MKEKRNLLIGIILSGIIGWTLGFLRLPYIEKNFSFYLGFMTCLALLFLGLILVVVWKKNSFLVRLFGKKSDESNSENGVKAYTLIWILVSAFILLGGLASSFLIFRQNEFSKNQIQIQNKKIAEQSVLIESTRKSNLIVLMDNIFDKIDEELKENPKRILSENTIERIAALNYSFMPVQYLEGDSLSEKKLSSERGQLLVVLSAMNMDSISFDKIKKKTSFLGADLRNANLKNADLSGIDLRKANLTDANLSGANLDSADLRDANLWGANLENVKMRAADLKKADLKWAELNGADLMNSNLNGADLTSSKLRSVNLRGADLGWAIFIGAILNKSNLAKANLTGTDFARANLSETILSNVVLKMANLSEAILDEANLTGAELFNAGVEEENWVEKLEGWNVIGAKKIQESYKTAIDISKAYNYRIKRIKK